MTARSLARQTLIGVLMLPITLLPFIMYFRSTAEGRVLWAKVSTTVAPPSVPVLTPTEHDRATSLAPRYEDAVASLVYHGLGSPNTGEGRFTIPPHRFAEQLAWLDAAGFETVTAADVALAYAGVASLPDRAVMISFDDGRTDALLYADPVLEHLDMRATMFTITDAAARASVYYASWDKLASLAATGRWDIQSHSANSHSEHVSVGGRSRPVLVSLAPAETTDGYTRRVRADLRRAATTIEDRTGRPSLAFAYPFGAHASADDDRTDDARVGRIFRDAVGSTSVVAFHQDDQDAWTLTTCTEDRLGLRRLEVGDWSGPELVQRIAAGAEGIDRGSCTAGRDVDVPDGVLPR